MKHTKKMTAILAMMVLFLSTGYADEILEDAEIQENNEVVVTSLEVLGEEDHDDLEETEEYEEVEDETLSLESMLLLDEEPTFLTTDISGVDAIDSTTLLVSLSGDITEIGADSDAKILENLEINSLEVDGDNFSKAILHLEKDLELGKSYSLFSINESFDVNFDFVMHAFDESLQSDIGLGISSVIALEGGVLEVYFDQEVTEGDLDLKLYRENTSRNIFLDTSALSIELEEELSSNSSHILLLNLKDISGRDIEVDTLLYDFMTPEFQVKEDEEDFDLNSAEEEENPIEEVAMEVTSTPDTGANTTLLLLMTMILAMSIVLMRKKSLKN